VLVAQLAAPWVRMTGFVEVVREGVGLRWAGGLILVDEPCSGIRMLWTGFYIAFVMAVLTQLPFLRLLALCVCTVGSVILSNLFRAVCLFQGEARGGLQVDEPLHAIVGLCCFALGGIAILYATAWLRPRVPEP
jgi:exosortase/archaeosortase family protein